MASRRLSQLWTAQRAAGWGYANKGDTRFAAERRTNLQKNPCAVQHGRRFA